MSHAAEPSAAAVPPPSDPPVAAPDGEVVELCRDLIRLDTTNFGDGSGPGERAAAEHVAALLAEVGLQPEIYESAPGRASVVARVPGADPTRTDALLLHGHLDVVPAEPADWRFDPFAAEIADGCVWGRGAVDMKDMDAMILSVVRDRLRTGRLPARPVVLAFLADEEAGGVLGSHWMVDHHPDLFADCAEGISEVGGFSLTVRDDLRLYLVEAAQKGISWMRLSVTGTAGHGSMVNRDNAVSELCAAVTRLAEHRWPVRLTSTVRQLLGELKQAFGASIDPEDDAALPAVLGGLAALVGATVRNTANPTALKAGYKHNVIPARAEAYVDGRFLPGYEAEFEATLDEVLGPRVQRDTLVRDIALETPWSGALVDAMQAALHAEDPGARAVPYCLSGGTDAKAFSQLGVRAFGFSPLRLPPDLDFAALFHGVDERVPVDALTFGARVLDRVLDLA